MLCYPNSYFQSPALLDLFQPHNVLKFDGAREHERVSNQYYKIKASLCVGMHLNHKSDQTTVKIKCDKEFSSVFCKSHLHGLQLRFSVKTV